MPNKIDLLFPAAGVERRHGLLAATGGRAPHPAPWAINVRLEDALTNRLRGGSFTPIAAGDRPTSVVYRNRTLRIRGNAIEASRVGNAADYSFDTDVSDVQRPAYVPLALAAGSGGLPIGMAPHNDQSIIAWTATETWVVLGNPAEPRTRRISPEVGIIGADAWCAAHDTIYWLSSRGLHSIGADGGGFKPISEDKIPGHLIGLTDDTATLTYNHADRGIYIHTTESVDWFYDIARDQFWPFDSSGTSHVLIGPFRLAEGESYGRLLHLDGTIAESSASVTWKIVEGDTAEAAASNGKALIDGGGDAGNVVATGTWTAGRAHRSHPRNRSMWCCLWLSSSGTWAFERATAVVTQSGKWR